MDFADDSGFGFRCRYIHWVDSMEETEKAKSAPEYGSCGGLCHNFRRWPEVGWEI